jgi:Flp pilus assembly protein TadG
MRRHRGEKGAALLEAALTIPILLLVAVGIFELGRAYQTWQILTNAAREGARVSVLPNQTTATIEGRVRDCMVSGHLPQSGTASVTVNRDASLAMGSSFVSASQITVDYPFEFIVLRPVARLVSARSTMPGALTIRAVSVMRNETQ